MVNTENPTSVQFTTSEQILSCISEVIKIFNYSYPNRKSDIDTYFSLWEQLFRKLTDSNVNNIPENTFQYTINYPFLTHPLYVVFNIDSIVKDTDALIKTTLNNINYDKSLITTDAAESAQPLNMNKPILICDSLSVPIIIDGRRCYQNAVSHGLDIPVNILPYMNLSKQHFIDEFNYAVFIFAEETNYCIKNFDEASLMHSYLRMGNKFIF